MFRWTIYLVSHRLLRRFWSEEDVGWSCCSGVNSLIVCVIGLHTSQYGFILRMFLHLHKRIQSSGMVKGAQISIRLDE